MTIKRSEQSLTEQEWERQMVDSGRERFRKENLRLERDQREDETTYGRRTTSLNIEPLAKAIETYTQQLQAGGEGRPSGLVRYLAMFSPMTEWHEVLAAHTIQEAQRGLAPTLDAEKQVKARPTVERIARAIEHEARMRYLDQFSREEGAAEGWQEWPENDCLRLGSDLLALCAKSTRVLKITLARRKVGTKVKSEWQVEYTADQQRFRRDTLDALADRRPRYMPTIEEPQPWDVEGQRGGYHHIYRPLVREREHPTGILSQSVVDAVNTIQATPWKINTQVLEVMQAIWIEGIEVGKIPAKPARPRWAGNSKQWSKRNKAEYTLGAAVACREFKRIYFPHQLDWRGRFYAIAEHLTPQGPDYSRGLLTFAEGQPIAQEHGERWLAIHGANCFGKGLGGPDISKYTFSDRETLVGFMEEDILKSASDPLGHRWWTQADDPWQFLAFCFEWAEYKRVGDGFVSRLPIAVDGTCNGLQHYAAMLLDPIGGAAVNLAEPKQTGFVDTILSQPKDEDDSIDEDPIMEVEPPQDIYQRVADQVAIRIRLSDDYLTWLARWSEKQKDPAKITRANATKDADAARLFRWGQDGTINRKMVKSHAMTFVYGKTDFGRWKTLKQYLTDRTESATREPLWPEVPAPVVTYLREIITSVIKDCVPAAKDAMKWLHNIAGLLAEANEPVKWTTPAGMEITQHYRDISGRQVKIRTRRNAKFQPITKLSSNEARPSDPMRVRKQATAFAPNFVHSLDASHLVETVRLAKSRGITSFAMVHDSYATTAAQTEALTAALTTAFRTLYQQHDVLAELREGVAAVLGDTEVPAAPLRGDLELGAMPYLFS